MTIRRVLLADNPEDNRILRQKAKKITNVHDPSLQRLINDMLDTMRSEYGVGLAAPQVGVLWRVLVIEVPKELEDEPMAGKTLVMINPEITKIENEWDPIEGCLSYPGWEANITRAYRIWAKYKDRKGRDMKIQAEGLLAQAIQHEIDHLNGVLFFDRLPSMDLLRKIDEEERKRKLEELANAQEAIPAR